jgi:hypothetical protein
VKRDWTRPVEVRNQSRSQRCIGLPVAAGFMCVEPGHRLFCLDPHVRSWPPDIALRIRSLGASERIKDMS